MFHIGYLLGVFGVDAGLVYYQVIDYFLIEPIVLEGIKRFARGCALTAVWHCSIFGTGVIFLTLNYLGYRL